MDLSLPSKHYSSTPSDTVEEKIIRYKKNIIVNKNLIQFAKEHMNSLSKDRHKPFELGCSFSSPCVQLLEEENQAYEREIQNLLSQR